MSQREASPNKNNNLKDINNKNQRQEKRLIFANLFIYF